MVAVNVINKCLPPNINSAFYVDDYVLYSSKRVPREMKHWLQNATNELTVRFIALIYFRKYKSCNYAFMQKEGCPKIAHKMAMYSISIKCADSQTFLWLIIYNGVKWNKHMQEITALYKKVSLLNHLSHQIWGAVYTIYIIQYKMLYHSVHTSLDDAGNCCNSNDILPNLSLCTLLCLYRYVS